jgi:ATP-dependent Clp protease ATP-binding subunit ClpC
MFERFTNQSRRVVVLAQEEARKLNHNYIGTEHLLMGLLGEDRGAAARALASVDITLEAVQREVEVLIGRGKKAPSGHIPFTPGAKKCLELSLREALQLGHNYIGTGHLLLGLIRKGDGAAVQVLGRLGADLDHLRQRVTLELEDQQEDYGGPYEPVSLQVKPRDDAIRVLLDRIDDRLSAIERHLGIARPEPSATSETSTKAEASASFPGPDEVARMQAEVARLRVLLREHDIDPGEPGAPHAAAG